MPRVSREQTDKNRACIEEVSARLFREQGINGVSVADIMAAAGLTHGGFYGHFQSKDALAAIACAKAFAQSEQRWAERARGRTEQQSVFNAIVAGYLSQQNRDDVGQSCPIATFAGDVTREESDKPVRQAYLTGIKTAIDSLASLTQTDANLTAREKALADLATMVGALLLSRATKDDPISEEILVAARKFLIGNQGE